MNGAPSRSIPRAYCRSGRSRLDEFDHVPVRPNQYSPAQFDTFVKQNADLIDKAYSPTQALVIKNVNKELQIMAGTDAARPAGTSGTTTTGLANKSHNVLSVVLSGAAGGSVGAFLGHMIEPGGLGEALGSLVGDVGGASIAAARGKSQAAFQAIRTQALLDPAFARSLMVKYNPGAPTASMDKALNYVTQRLPSASTPALTGPQ